MNFISQEKKLIILIVAFQLLKSRNVRIIVIGIGDGVNLDELNLIASEPSSENVFTTDRFDELLGIVTNVAEIVCSN